MKIEIDLTDKQAKFLKKFYRNHHPGTERDQLIERPLFKVQSIVGSGYSNVATFFIREEAFNYIRQQRRHLARPKVVPVSSGFQNNGEYSHFYDLLMDIGKRLCNDEENINL